jgi:hypothetical protein
MAGSETACYTLAAEFIRLGYKVSAFSLHLGKVAEKMKGLGVNILDKSELLKKDKSDFDICFANHCGPTDVIRRAFPDLPIVQTVHGITGNAESPLPGCQAYISVSEETQDVLKRFYRVESTIIRNAVNTERFNEVTPRNESLKKVLVSSSYYSKDHPIFQIIKSAVEEFGAELVAIGRFMDWQWSTEKIYNNVDLVITMGRGAIEAMSCNRPIIVAGHHGKTQPLSSDGIVSKDNIEEIRKNNFSSRRFRSEWKKEDFIEAFKKYDNTTNYRELVLANHDITKIAQEYLNVYPVKNEEANRTQ